MFRTERWVGFVEPREAETESRRDFSVMLADVNG
jgi:hypothetical protein